MLEPVAVVRCHALAQWARFRIGRRAGRQGWGGKLGKGPIKGAVACLRLPRLRGKTAQQQRGGNQPENSPVRLQGALRSEEHTSELQSLMRISYAVFCLKKK